MTTDSWLLELLYTPFDHVIVRSYKKGSAHPSESDLYVCNRYPPPSLWANDMPYKPLQLDHMK